MKLEVRFIGLCMFNARSVEPGDRELVTVLMPDARREKKLKHKDHHAVKDDHDSCLIFRSTPPANVNRRYEIGNGTTAEEVVFDGTVIGTNARGSLEGLVDVADIGDGLHFEPDHVLQTAMAGFVRLNGGTFEVRRSGKAVKFRGTLKKNGQDHIVHDVGTYVTWTGSFESPVNVTIGGRPVATLKEDAKLCIMNACDANIAKRCCNPDERELKPSKDDPDFKWYFQLLESKPDSIQQRLNGKELPKPIRLNNVAGSLLTPRGCLPFGSFFRRLGSEPPVSGDPPKCLSAFSNFALTL